MKNNVYQIVTNRIIEQLEQGVIPWHKPWTGIRTKAFNRISRKPYSLLNQMLLKHDGEYASFKQWTELGGKIRKGEKAEIVVFWKMLEVEKENKDGELEKKTVPYLRYVSVFHISQVDGVKPLEEPFHEVEPIDSTTFHELVHSTGHKNRLNRLETTAVASFGSETYSKEELVAEIGSATILSALEIETKRTFTNSVAYIQNWLNVLKNDNRFIISASSQAEKAVDYILA